MGSFPFCIPFHFDVPGSSFLQLVLDTLDIYMASVVSLAASSPPVLGIEKALELSALELILLSDPPLDTLLRGGVGSILKYELVQALSR